MCVDLIRYNLCNHERRRFLKNCKFVRNAGCFEPICAYFFGERGPNPCQFPEDTGKIYIIEGRRPSIYRLDQSMMAAGDREEYGYCPPAPETHLYRHEQKVYRETDDEVAEPHGVPLDWPFRDHTNREQMAPSLEVGPQPIHNPPQQTQDGDAGKPARDDRSNRALEKLEAETSQGSPTSHSWREGPRRPLSWSSEVSESGWFEKSSTVMRPLGKMYRIIQEGPVQQQGNELKKNKKKKRGREGERRASFPPPQLD